MRLLLREISNMDKNAYKITQNSDFWMNLFDRVFDQSLIGMAMLDSDDVFLRVNQAFAMMLEYTPEELIGRTWQSVTNPDDRFMSAAFLQDHLAYYPSELRSVEKRYVSKSGENVFCRITTFFVDNPDNQHHIHRVTQVENRTDIVVLKEKLTQFRSELAN